MLGLSVVILLIGFALMSGGGSSDPEVFDPEIFNHRRISVAPLVILSGYALAGWAILKKTHPPQ